MRYILAFAVVVGAGVVSLAVAITFLSFIGAILWGIFSAIFS